MSVFNVGSESAQLDYWSRLERVENIRAKLTLGEEITDIELILLSQMSILFELQQVQFRIMQLEKFMRP